MITQRLGLNTLGPRGQTQSQSGLVCSRPRTLRPCLAAKGACRSFRSFRNDRRGHILKAEVIDAEAENVDPVEAKEGEVIEDDVVDEEEEEELDEEEEELTPEEFEFLMDQPDPSNLQQTLYRSFVIEAPCQHGGHTACIKVKPAYANEGRYFVVVPNGSIPPPEDLPPEAEAKLKAVEEAHEAEEQGKAPPGGKSSRDLEEELTVDIKPDELTQRSSEEGDVILPSLDNASIIPEDALFLTHEQGDNRIINAETLLAALEAMGVDNARIEIEAKEDGSKPLEVPCPDGSAAVVSDFIKFAGTRYAPSIDGTEHVPKTRLVPSKVISVREGNSFIQLIPGTGKRISVGVEHIEEAPVIGCQWASWGPTDAITMHWRWNIAPARPYIVSPQIAQAMQAEGYFQGAGDETVAVANFEQWNQEEHMRYEDEPARRKVLEFVADLSLLSQNGSGGIPEGHIVAFQPSRELQLRFLKAVLKNSEKIPESSEVPKIPTEEEEIQE